MLGTHTDITARKQVEQEREQLLERERIAREQAETANRVKDEFLAVLSHELRSPLNPILGWSKMLQSRQLDQKTTARALATIERNARLQNQLIGDLLDVSRILQGKTTLNIAPVNLAATITAAMETVRLAAEAKSISIQTAFARIMKPVAGDSARLQQIVWNLLSNAVKFTPEGGRIEVRLEQVRNRSVDEWMREDNDLSCSPSIHSYAQITVSDTGKGISPEFLPYVFDYFRQADSATTRKFGGLGLGLAIVRHLVELHGGTVKAESPGEGRGATFTVRLPLMKNKVQERSATDEATDVLACLPLAGVQILVVDDEADTRDYLSFVLEQAGATVTVAASADEALQALASSKPDVLLSDIGMPDVDGYMLVRQVQALETKLGARVPAVALTAYASEIDRQQALAAGFVQHLSKPVEPEELVKAIVYAIA
jgi:signal transduction histidine kinase/CheY-like chemotaxis protein